MCSTLFVSGDEKSRSIKANAGAPRLNTSYSVNLQVWGRGAVPPLVDLFCDDGAAEGAAFLPVKPQSDALVTEYMLHDRKAFIIKNIGVLHPPCLKGSQKQKVQMDEEQQVL